MHRDSVVRCFDFYPRPPRGGRRLPSLHQFLRLSISIHALREEGDLLLPGLDLFQLRISIHALREEGDYALLSCL